MPPFKYIERFGTENRKIVVEISHELDPESVALRRRKHLRRRVYSVPGPDFF